MMEKYSSWRSAETPYSNIEVLQIMNNSSICKTWQKKFCVLIFLQIFKFYFNHEIWKLPLNNSQNQFAFSYFKSFFPFSVWYIYLSTIFSSYNLVDIEKKQYNRVIWWKTFSNVFRTNSPTVNTETQSKKHIYI